MLRHDWGVESFASINIRSLVYNNIRNLTVLWFPMKKKTLVDVAQKQKMTK